MTSEHKPITFNGPLEAGIRAVSILAAAHPESFDLQRLVALDYLLVHTGDIDGPANLHPPTPMHSAELLVRRGLVEQALLLMMTRHLVERQIASDGIRYVAGENAATFLSTATSSYFAALTERATWLTETFGSYTDDEFRAVMRHLFDRWVEEFHYGDTGVGGQA
jgi:hypothetical protein